MRKNFLDTLYVWWQKICLVDFIMEFLERISPNQYHIDIDVSETNKKIYQNSVLDGLSISNISSYECENKVLQEGLLKK